MWQQDVALSPCSTGYVPRPRVSSVPDASNSSVPATRRVDMRWSRLTMDQLRDEEFMAKQLRRIEITVGARRTGNTPGAGRWVATSRPHSSSVTTGSPRMSIRQRLLKAQSKAARGMTGDPDDDEYDELNDPVGDAGLKYGAAVRENELEEKSEREWMNTLYVLGDLDQPELVALMMENLKEALHRGCTFPNPVYQLVALQRQILRKMHEAIAIQHRQQRAAVKFSMSILEYLQNPGKCMNPAPLTSSTDMDRERSQLSYPPSDSLTTNSSSSQPFMKPKERAVREAAMGIQVLLCVLTELHDTNVTTLTQKKEFLGDLLPLIRSMAPLALAPKRRLNTHSSVPPPSTIRGHSLRLVDPSGASGSGYSDISEFAERVQRFLLDICPRPVLKPRPSSSPKLQAITPANSDLDIAEHTDAVHALIHLAAATGSVRDFLVALRVLLGASDSASEVVTKENRGSLTAHSLPLTASVPSLSTVHAEDLFSSPRDSEQQADRATRVKVQTKMENTYHPDTISKSQQESPSSKRESEALGESEVQELLKRKTLPKGLKTITTTVSSGTTVANLSIPHPGSHHHRLYSGPGNSLVSKQRGKEELKDALLLGSGSLALDISKMKDVVSRDGAHAAASTSRNEVPIFTARCPKFKALNIHSVLRELDRTKLPTPSRAPRGKTPAYFQPTYASVLGIDGDTGLFEVDDDQEDREVWSCGQNSYGELGHGDTMSRKSFERIEFLQQKDVVQIGAGNEHTIALTAEGKVLTCGYNDNGQCGQGDTTRVGHLSEIPKMADNLIAQVHAYNGCEHTILVTLDGRAVTCGYNYRGQLGHGNTTSESVPKLVRSLENRIVRLVSCSYYHTIMVCEGDGGGRQYACTFGRNDYGQLGHNDSIDRKVPQQLEALNDQHVVSVACGQYHTMVVTATGKVFGFGKNDYGQLGVDSMENQLVPVQVRGGLEKQECVEVRCGYYHSIVLCSGAHLYGFGRNDYGQLGLGRASASSAANLQLQQQRFPYARLLEELEGKEIIRFACGCYHTVAVSENGVMYVFGRNNHGQLGTGDTNERVYPFPIDDFVGKRVAMVAAGFYHTVVLTGGKEEEANEKDFEECEKGEGLSRPTPGGITHSVILAAPPVQDLLDPSEGSESDGTVTQSIDQMKANFLADVGPSGAEVPASNPDDDDYRDEDDRFIEDATKKTLSRRASNRLEPGRAAADSTDTLVVAAAIMAQLDRLCQPFLPKPGTAPTLQYPTPKAIETLLMEGGSFPGTLSRSADMGDVFEGSFEPFVVHVCSSTFDSLAALLKHLSSKKIEATSQLQLCLERQQGYSIRGAGMTPRRTSHPSQGNQVQMYMLVVCLRILQANLSQLLRSGLAKAVILFSHGNEPRKSMAKGTNDANPYVKELSRLRSAILQIRDVLVSLIDIKYSKNVCYVLDNAPIGGENTSRIATEACNTLMQGFELFFPCQCVQWYVFLHVVQSDTSVDDAPHEPCGAQCRYDHWSVNVVPKTKKLLLGPLLRRMAEDSLILRFLPLSASVLQTANSTTPSTLERSVLGMKEKQLSMISDIWQTVLEQVAVDFAQQLGDLSTVLPTSNCSKTSLTATSSFFAMLCGIQKHISSWAASCAEWRLEHRDKSESLNMRIANVIDRAFRIDVEDLERVPVAWRCLLEFALAVTTQCCDVFVQASSSDVAPSPTHAHTREFHHSTNFSQKESVEALQAGIRSVVEQSIVGQALPSLIGSLFEFSNNPLFAATLLPNLKGLLRLLDGFNQRDPAFAEAEERFIESMAHLTLSREALKSEEGLFRRRSTGTTHTGSTRAEEIKTSRSTDLTISDAMALPWNYRLQKELAVLVSEMAITLVVGDPFFTCDFSRSAEYQHPANNHADETNISARWFSSPLLRGGLSSQLWAESVGHKATPADKTRNDRSHTSQHTPFPTAETSLPASLRGDFASFSLTLPPFTATLGRNGGRNYWEFPKDLVDERKYAHTFCCESVQVFLTSFQQCLEVQETASDSGVAAQNICNWVRDSYSKHDPSYRMIARQAQTAMNSKAPMNTTERQIHLNDLRIEAAMFAVLLHHNVLAQQAYHFALAQGLSTGGARKSPPRSFLSLWAFVAELRRRVASKKTEIKNTSSSMNKTEGGKSEQTPLDRVICLQQTILDRCKLLLLIDVHAEEEHLAFQLDAGFIPPYDPAITGSPSSAFTIVGRSVKRHLQATYTHDKLSFLAAFPLSKWRKVRMLVHTITRWKSAATAFASKQLLAGGVSQEALDFVMSNEDVSSANAIFLLLVDPCRRISCSTRGLAYLWELLTMVTFDSIQADIVHQVSQALNFQVSNSQHTMFHQRLGYQNIGCYYSSLHNEALAEFMAQLTDIVTDKASLMLETSNSSGMTAFWVVIELLSAWGMHFGTEQFEFVSDIGILPVIREIMQSCSATSGTTPRGSSSGSNFSSSLASMDDTNARGGSQTVRLQATTARQKQRLKETLWVLFRYIGIHFSAQSTQQDIARDPNSRPTICAPAYPALSSVMNLIYDEAAEISRELLPPRAPEACSPIEEPEVAASIAPGVMRRSFEVIVLPRRFSSLSKGLTFGYDEMISPPCAISPSGVSVPMSPLLKANEYSITAWVFVNPSGHSQASLATAPFLDNALAPEEPELVFLRGAGHEISLYMLLLPESSGNWQIEVGFLIDLTKDGHSSAVEASSSGNLSMNSLIWERVVSKQVVGGGKWVHVAVVLEAAKIRLYLNGILDCQRSISTQSIPTWAASSVDLPFHFGRFPTATETACPPSSKSVAPSVDSALKLLSGSLTLKKVSASRNSGMMLAKNSSSEIEATLPLGAFRCFEGWLSHFRFHNRSLSPIHVRIVFDEKKQTKTPIPGCIRSKHTKVIELHALLMTLSASSEGAVHFAAQFPKWLRLLWGSFLGSSCRLVQQSALRVLRSLLPLQYPLQASQVLLQDEVNVPYGDKKIFGFYTLEDAFVQQLIRIIGFCLSKCPSEKLSRLKEGITEVGTPKELPWTLTLARGIHGDIFSSSIRKSTSEHCGLADNMEILYQSSKGDCLMLANELVQLIQHLLQCSSDKRNLWTRSFARVVPKIISNLQESEETSTQKDTPFIGLRFGDRVVQASVTRKLEVVGCLYTLGGGIDMLRPGAKVQIRGTHDFVRVIALEPRYGISSTQNSPPCVDSSQNRAGGTNAVALVATSCSDTLAHLPTQQYQFRGCTVPAPASTLSWYQTVLNHDTDRKTHHVEYRHVNVEDLVPVEDQSFLSFTGTDWSALSILESHENIEHMSRALLQNAEVVLADWHESNLGFQQRHTISSAKIVESTVSSAESEMLSAHFSVFLLKTLTQVAGSEAGPGELLLRPGLVSSILKLAISEDGNTAYDTLSQVERKVALLRQQLYAVLVDLEDEAEVELARCYHSKRQGVDDSSHNDGGKGVQSGGAGSQNPIHSEQDKAVSLAKSTISNLLADDNSFGDLGTGAAHQSIHTPVSETHANHDGGEEEEEDDEEGEDEEDESMDEDEEDEDEMDEVGAELVEELMLMGFPEDWCVLALKQTGNDIVSASAWIVDNLEYLSKLQSTLDKHGEQGRDSPRFDEEEDDVTNHDEVPGAQPGHLSEFRASNLNGDDASGNAMCDSNGQEMNNVPGKCDIDSAHVRDNYKGYVVPPLNDKEMARKIFGEMYFPFEEGGYLSNTRSQFLRSWRAGTLEMKPKSSHSRSDSTSDSMNSVFSNSPDGAKPSPFQDEFQTQAYRLPFDDLIRQLRSLEHTLSILYARQCMCTLLQQVTHAYTKIGGTGTPGRPALTSEQRLVITYAEFFRLMKLVLKRGDQFTVRSRTYVSSAKDNELQESSIESAFSSALDYFAELDLEGFTRAAFDFCIQELETAAASKPYEAILWGQRELQRPDKAVVAEPGVEVVAWILDVLLAKPCGPRIISALENATGAVQRLRCCLSATNLPLKFLVIRTISRILMLVSSSQSAIEPKKLVLESQLSVADFMGAAKMRHSREYVQDRLLFSLYLQGFVELLHVLQSITGYTDQNVESHLSKSTLSIPGVMDCRGQVLHPPTCILPPATPRSQKAEDCSLRFDRKRSRSSLLTFADDGLSVSYSGNEIWKAACATVSFSTGVHSWEIRVEKSSSPYLFIGIATKRANLDSFLGSDDQSWGFIGDKALYYQRNRLRSYGEAFGEEDCIGVHLDCEKGEISFTKNGVHLGLAFDNIVGDVCPAVAFYSRHQKVSFVKYSCVSMGETDGFPTSPTGEDERASVEDSLVACEVMEALAEKKRLRASVCSAVHGMTTAWLEGYTKFVTTRAGKPLWVDVTRESCRKLGFQANERVRTPRGNGVVVGVSGGRIWVEVDSEPGAWFFHPSKLRLLTLINAQGTALPTPPIASKHTDSTSIELSTTNANSGEEVPRTDDDVAVKSATGVTQSTLNLSLESLAEISAHPLWDLNVDRELLSLVNDFCEVSRINPWNLTADQLLSLVRENAPALELTPMANVLALSREVREQLVVARFALLRFCNVYVSRALPFFDLTWHYFLLQSSPLPGCLLSKCRGSLFVSVKNAIFTALMEKTANSPKRADDEYDYPDDLPQLQVNRLKAAAAKCHPGTTDSLFLSLFGQAFEELHFLPLKTLRMVYSHPMDDGQLRSFKVKFEGEGVDDYGGPYREFFSQFFAELQMLQVPPAQDRESNTTDENNRSATVKQESGISVSTCLLPFLLPSPNWRNGVGANREKFVLNGALISRRFGTGSNFSWNRKASPNSQAATMEQDAATCAQESVEEKRQLYCEMFYFLGQMLGICLRTRVCVRLDLAMTVWKQLVVEDMSSPESALATLKEIDFVSYSLWKTLKNILEDHKKLQVASDDATTATKIRNLEDQLESMDLDFTTVLSDGRTVDLCLNGSDTAVTLSNLEAYLDSMLLARMNETQEAMNIVKQGLHSILPVSAMALLTWSELEKRICGVAEVDVQLLQSNTEYDEELSADDEFIQRFWRVLEGMDAEDKRAFLRFVWARSRLPLGSAQFHQKFKIQALTAPGSDGNSNVVPPSGGWMDSQLPKSHTCFFALQLPRYSTDEICRTRLLYAIRNCVEMDGDFRLADTEMTGWTGISPTDQLRM